MGEGENGMSQDKKIEDKTNSENDFDISFMSRVDENTTILTTSEKIEQKINEMMLSAIERYDPSNRQYSAYMLDKSNDDIITPNYIDELVRGINTNVKQLQKANALVKRYILTDDIIGKTYESIESNVNTQIRLNFPKLTDSKRVQKKISTARIIIDNFNDQINLKQLIRDSIPLTYANGNRILCLKYNGKSYIVDSYPVGIAEISSYDNRGNPIVKINMTELQNRLKKTYTKNKKGKPQFFKNIEEEIKANFPLEVYEAYRNKESEVILDDQYTGVMRINNLGLQYGVSPILRAIKSALMLANIENTDFVNNKAKAKKIIHQVMRKETMGNNYDKKGLGETSKAHDDLMQAWKSKTVVYTSMPQVEKIVYVEPQVDDSSPEKVNLYRSKEMSTLGIGFIDTNVANFSVANISLDQLMKVVNSISSQLEVIIQRWYRIVLQNAGIEADYVPTIQILDSEQMSFEMKKEIATTLYTIFNSSMSTSLEILGIDVEDEKLKRQKENDEGYSEIFQCRQTAYTSSGDGNVNNVGRPADGKDKDKQDDDKNYNQKVRE